MAEDGTDVGGGVADGLGRIADALRDIHSVLVEINDSLRAKEVSKSKRFSAVREGVEGEKDAEGDASTVGVAALLEKLLRIMQLLSTEGVVMRQ